MNDKEEEKLRRVAFAALNKAMEQLELTELFSSLALVSTVRVSGGSFLQWVRSGNHYEVSGAIQRVAHELVAGDEAVVVKPEEP